MATKSPATVVTNAVVNQAGCTLLVDLAKETQLSVDQLVVRYLICDELVGGRALREAIHGCDYAVAAGDQYAALLALEEVLDQARFADDEPGGPEQARQGA